MLNEFERHFHQLTDALEPGVWASLRLVHSESESLAVDRGVVSPPRFSHDLGAMWTVLAGGGLGYAGTADLTLDGLADALGEARRWARLTAATGAPRGPQLPAAPSGPAPAADIGKRLSRGSTTLAERIELLEAETSRLKSDARIVDWGCGLWRSEQTSLLLTSAGGRVEQSFTFIVPTMRVAAHANGETQARTFKGGALARQGDMEILNRSGFLDAAPRLADQALALVYAPDCPEGFTDVLLAPDQLILQIHESIGHPLELDRILGDERNYAGASFVTPQMFGTYQYGSALLNITFDPSVCGEFASFGFDDEGAAAERVYLIRNGVLERGLGGALSQQRSGLPGTANARASGWNRPPIDRMANLNLEPGDASFDELVGAIEDGIYMETNSSWSIDDARNKFQFGCEWGQRIRNGKLGPVVKKPNYRGHSANFWRSLAAVGDRQTWELLGTPYCGKGEPNQAIRVGHAAPACLFRSVDVFGGA